MGGPPLGSYSVLCASRSPTARHGAYDQLSMWPLAKDRDAVRLGTCAAANAVRAGWASGHFVLRSKPAERWG